eukprot:4158742-Amphidinium_carterae.1
MEPRPTNERVLDAGHWPQPLLHIVGPTNRQCLQRWLSQGKTLYTRARASGQAKAVVITCQHLPEAPMQVNQ